MCSALFEVHAKHRLVTNAVQKIVFSNSVRLGSLQKKTAGWSTQLSPGKFIKNAFLKTFCNKYKRSFFLSSATPLK